MAWNISEIMENENVPGCNLNIEQLEGGSKKRINIKCIHKYSNNQLAIEEIILEHFTFSWNIESVESGNVGAEIGNL